MPSDCPGEMAESRPGANQTELAQWRTPSFIQESQARRNWETRFYLRRMFSAWKKEDSPPSRVEPVPMKIILRAAELCGRSAYEQATIDCIWRAFYFLLRPGEYAIYFLLRPGEYAKASGNAKHPFRLEDVECKIGHQHIFDVHLASVAQLLSATFISLTLITHPHHSKEWCQR